MSLLSEVDAIVYEARMCPVARWAEGLPPKDGAELVEAIGSEHPLSIIFQAISARDPKIPFSVDTFTRHYMYDRGGRRRCSCRS